MGMILRIASSRIVGQGDIVGRSGYFSLNLSANSVMRGRLDARRTLKSLVADLRDIKLTTARNVLQSTFCESHTSLIHFSPNPNDIPKRLIDMRICALLFMASLILSLGLILKCLAILIQLFIQFILLDSVVCCTKIGILL